MMFAFFRSRSWESQDKGTPSGDRRPSYCISCEEGTRGAAMDGEVGGDSILEAELSSPGELAQDSPVRKLP